MTRQERRKQQRLGKVVKNLGFNKLKSLGFFYKGAGITTTINPEYLINIYEDVLPDYKSAIESNPNELNELFLQLDQCLPLLDTNTIDHQSASIFTMNVYCLTKLGYIKDDNMNGLQYMYSQTNK